MTTNNQYYKQILETLTGSTVTGTHSDNYFLKQICIHYGYTYTGTRCNGKLLKDMAEAVCDTTFSGNHFNNYFLRAMAEELAGEDLGNHSDNYFLGIIAERITRSTTVSLTVSDNQIEIGQLVTFSATVLDEHRDPIESATVSFKVNGVEVDTDDTNSEGVASIIYDHDTAETIAVTAEYDEYSSNAISIVVDKITAFVMAFSPDVTLAGDNMIISGSISAGLGSRYANRTLTFYEGSTNLGTATTDSSGGFSKSISTSVAGKRNITITGIEDELFRAISYTLSVTVSKRNDLNLSINVPGTVVYTDDFTIEGTLGYPVGQTTKLAGEQVSLYINGHRKAIALTDENGDVSFTQTPPSMNLMYIQLKYSGDGTRYESKESETLHIGASKETTLLEVTNITDYDEFYNDVNVLVEGTLMEADGVPTPMAGKSVSISGTGVTTTSGTVQSDGTFSISVPVSGTGDVTLTASYAGDSYYYDVSKQIIVTMNDPAVDIAKTAGKQILSFADKTTTGNTEYCTVTGTYTGGAVRGKSMKFYKYVDGTNDVLLDTVSTDGNGQASYTYVSAGAGDISIYAKVGSFESGTYTVHDAIYYHEGAFNSTTTLALSVIPTNFVATFKLYKPNQGTAWLEIGSDADNNLFGGCVGGAGILGTYARVNGNYADYNTVNNVFVANTTSDVELKYNNGVITTKANNQTATCNYAITDRGYQKITSIDNAKISNLLIMPLLSLSSNKSVLSYADSDTCTLTATHPLGTGQTVKLYDSSDDSLIGTMTDNNDGTYSYTYSSTGAGDIGFYAKSGNLVSETFSIYDYWKYDASVHSTSAEVVNWDLPTGDFEITAYIERGTGGAFIQLGDGTNSNRVLFGHTGSESAFKLWCGSNEYLNGSGNNTDHTLKIINGVAYYTVNGNTISQNAPTGLTHRLYQFAPWGNSKISNIRIKPL